MKILWFTWKDMKNPYAGGAEVVNEQLAQRLVADGHEVIFLTRSFLGAKKEETINGYKIIRMGNHHTVYWEAYKYYKKNLKGWADLVIEEVNTIPFFCNWYVKERNVLFFHQLCREIWFYEMGYLKGAIGYILETFYLFLLGNREVITVSQSTKKDLQKFGFKKDKIKIISEGIEIKPLESLDFVKYDAPTILAFGAVRAMKRTGHIVRAFEIAKEKIPNLRLVVAGGMGDKYGKEVAKIIDDSKFKDAIEVKGRVSDEEKINLMQKAHILAVTSVKEGWGLVVTEANSQGTPAVVYDVDGLRDSVRHNITGLVCEYNNPNGLATSFISMLGNSKKYSEIRLHAWDWSRGINFESCYDDFVKIVI